MSRPTDARAAERLAALSLFACAALAVLSLPRHQVPYGWMLAWTAPALAFGMLRRRPQHPWLRAVLAGAAQILAFATALHHLGPLSRPAVLACTILPPLAFVSAHRRDSDAALGLFLSFCVLLVGVILGGPDLPLLAGYAVAACMSLRSEAHLAVLTVSRRHPWRTIRRRALRPVLGTTLALALPCLFVAFAAERALAWIPSPLSRHDRTAAAADSRSQRRAGLDDHFHLGGGGVLSDLAGEELVLVRPLDRSPVPTDLYLRSGFFTAAHFDRWEIGALRLLSTAGKADHDLRRQTPVAPIRWLEVERFAGARNFVFVPPTALWLRDVPQLQVDPERLWLRQRPGAELASYRVGWQDLPEPHPGTQLESRRDLDELLALPADFTRDDRRRFEWLLDRWGATGTPWQIAERIAEGLGRHCRYDRVEPTGPWRRTLDNFLFAEGDRRGFCMHFASAAALMLRVRGIPCRIGVGLFGGQQDRLEEDARVYGSQHAHAWVEIPCSGRGFAVFDPTPAAERGQRMPTALFASAEDAADGGGERRDGADPWSSLLTFVTQPWLLILVLLAAVLVAMWPGQRHPEQRVVLPRSIVTARRLLVRILRALAESGLPRSRGQTLEQFSAALAARERLDPAVAVAFRTYQEVRFGGRTYDRERELQLHAGLVAARATAGPSADAAR